MLKLFNKFTNKFMQVKAKKYNASLSVCWIMVKILNILKGKLQDKLAIY